MRSVAPPPGGARPDRSGIPRCRLCQQAPLTPRVDPGEEGSGSCSRGGRVAAPRSCRRPSRRTPSCAATPNPACSARWQPTRCWWWPHRVPNRAPGGSRALILDTEVLLACCARQEEAARWWMAAVARTAPGATTMLVAPQDLDVSAADGRNDLDALAAAERASGRPRICRRCSRCVRLRGPQEAVSEWLGDYDGELLGPLDTVQGGEVLLLAPHDRAGALLRHVKQVQARRSKAGLQPVEIRVDPVDLGRG